MLGASLSFYSKLPQTSFSILQLKFYALTLVHNTFYIAAPLHFSSFAALKTATKHLLHAKVLMGIGL